MEFVSFETLLSALEYQKTGGYSSHVMQTAWQNNEGNFWRERNMIRHNAQKSLWIKGPDMQGVSIQLNGVIYGGPGLNITIGRVYEDGWFINVTNTVSAGFDLSLGISRIEGYYNGDDKPTSKSLSGGYFYSEGSAAVFSGGYWGSLSREGIGTEWSGGYYGFSFGVTPIGGAVGTGMTSRPYWFW